MCATVHNSIHQTFATYLERISMPQSRGMMEIGILAEPRDPFELDHVL